MFHFIAIGVTKFQCQRLGNINQMHVALGSHPDYDAQGWEFRANIYCLILAKINCIQGACAHLILGFNE